MNHNFSLPLRLHPRLLTAKDSDYSYDAQTISDAQLSDLKIQKRSQIFRKKLENVENQDVPSKSSPPSEVEADAVQSRSESTKQDFFLQNGILMPIAPRDHFREEAQLNDSSDDRATTKPSTSEILADNVSLLEMVTEKLRYIRSQTPSPESLRKHERSTSSSYPEQGIRSTSMGSPVSDTGMPRPSLGNLTQYSRTNDRLSGLRSSSSSSGATRAVSQGSTYRALADAAATISKLQRMPTASYHRFEVMSSSEDLSLNNKAPQNSIASQDSQTSSDDTVYLTGYTLTRVNTNTQFDSLTEHVHPDSPSPSIKPPLTSKTAKRKASGISLRSFTAGVKRSHAEIKKLGSKVCRTGSCKLRQACEKIKRRRKNHEKQYSAWKALRRRLKPGDAIKGKPEKGFVSFSIEKNFHGHESWWKVGVEKFQDPEWMQFGKEIES
ncbi:hypothetical protein NW762_002074 [Fusarium torreyae]|uniref:Uncharacterized protein n=1 Tax=Fusarium torreyae TaxID=1237075 RepID=A0A9W8VPH8_9HYPO|nr:hypothetical protein NW762_002074 [Fusarium torreyae]